MSKIKCSFLFSVYLTSLFFLLFSCVEETKDNTIGQGALPSPTDIVVTKPTRVPSGSSDGPNPTRYAMKVTWTAYASPNTKSYKVTLEDLTDPTKALLFYNVTNLEFDFNGLTADNSYKVQVVALDASGTKISPETISSITTFNTRNAANLSVPSQPILSPIVVTRETAIVSWTDSTDPDGYALTYDLIATPVGGGTPIQFLNLSVLTQKITGLTPNKEYIFSVNAKNFRSTSAKDNKRMFTHAKLEINNLIVTPGPSPGPQPPVTDIDAYISYLTYNLHTQADFSWELANVYSSIKPVSLQYQSPTGTLNRVNSYTSTSTSAKAVDLIPSINTPPFVSEYTFRVCIKDDEEGEACRNVTTIMNSHPKDNY